MPVPAIIAGAAAVAGRLATKQVAKTVAKKVQSQAVKQNKKTVEKVAKMQEKTKAEKIAKNSVKVKPATKAAVRLEKNSQAKANADTAKTGAMARYNAGQIEKARQLPSKVVKVKSGKDVKSAASSKRKLDSYTPNPERLPNLIKIDSAKGNSVKKTAYRPNKRSSK
jgi:hypothetical protein